MKILVRAPNWVGDAIMSMPAVERIRSAHPRAHLAVLARPWVAGLYRRPLVDETIPFDVAPDRKDLRGRWRIARSLRGRRFDVAILFQHAFDAALVAWLAGIPVRIGYDVKRRGMLLTQPIPLPRAGEIAAHQSFSYLELLRRAGLITTLPDRARFEFPDLPALRDAGMRRLPGVWIGVAPGSANGHAKRWLPDRFAEAAATAATAATARVAVFGSPDDRALCGSVAARIRDRGVEAVDFAGDTSIDDLLALVAACSAFLANDSGSMHVAEAVGVPTVAVFGPTDPAATGPVGPTSVVVREPVDCSPCLLHECPLDHRCMRAVGAERVAAEVIGAIQPAERRMTGAVP